MDGRREAGEASDPSLDCGDPALIERYDARIFRDMKDKQSLADAITAMDYPGVSRAYRMIDEYGVNVIVPYDTQAFARLRAMADAEGLTPALIREARTFCVNASLKQIENVAWAIPLKGFPNVAQNDWFFLGDPGRYDVETGSGLTRGTGLLMG